MLVHHHKELLPQARLAKITKKRSTQFLEFLLNKDFITTLAFQLDIQAVFKAISLEVQKDHGSFIGTKNKKDHILRGLDNLQQDRGEYMSKILLEMKCKLQNTNVFQVCRTLQAVDSATEIQWQNYDLDKTDPTKFEKLSSFKGYYIQTVRINVFSQI